MRGARAVDLLHKVVGHPGGEVLSSEVVVSGGRAHLRRALGYLRVPSSGARQRGQTGHRLPAAIF